MSAPRPSEGRARHPRAAASARPAAAPPAAASAPLDPARLARFQEDLLAWWVTDGRHDLPWREVRDPWAVLVSELMLQQTQVARVRPRYADFLARFPTPVACAAQPAGAVVEAWAGLGYNRRALNLHRCAVVVTEHHDGTLPAELDALLALPGIGPYTARAVLVFAHEADIGLVDTTAGRVLARAVAGRSMPPREAQAIADSAVPAGEGWRWGQAMFDLGATVCAKRNPACDRCPVQTSCAWERAGFPEPDPVHGSAGVSAPQSKFEGSFRQGRGRLVDALRRGPVRRSALAEACGWPDDPARAARAAESLVADGLARWDDGADADEALRLP